MPQTTQGPHTPGPWTIRKSEYANASTSIYGPDRVLIADIMDDESPDHPKYEANARLIASAPDMLKALEEVFHCFDEPSATSYDYVARIKQRDAARRSVRAAIALATGQTE